jgi:hypothetical protein
MTERFDPNFNRLLDREAEPDHPPPEPGTPMGTPPPAVESEEDDE